MSRSWKGQASTEHVEGPRALRAAVLVLVLLIGLGGCRGSEGRPVTLGVPTTVHDSGLFEVLREGFWEAQREYRLKIVAGSSGELLNLAARGDLDVIISHSPAAELAFIEAGHGLSRRPLMQNDFIIVGPPSDPAGVRGMDDAAAAFALIAQRAARFVSRGDESGTHVKERELWARSSLSPNEAEYREMGQGMGDVLRASSETGSYTLTDRGTYLSLAEGLELDVLVEKDRRLLNIYSVIVVNDARNFEGAKEFAAWVSSEAGLNAIAGYGREQFGESLYEPIRLP